MKAKGLWCAALIMLAVLAVAYWRLQHINTSLVGIGVGPDAVLFRAPDSPLLYWGEVETFKDAGLSVPSSRLKQAQSLTNFPLNERRSWASDLAVQPLQPGAWLLTVAGQRVWLFADPFTPEELNPTQALRYDSDWTILQRSSLLPSTWPEPRQGWVVLNRQLSQHIKDLSIAAQKPIIQPESTGTVWLQWDETAWEVLSPQ